MAAKLSLVMAGALLTLKEHGALERWPGGFWTYPGCDVIGSCPGWGGSVLKVPAWHVSAGTIHALVNRGLARENDGGELPKVVPTDDA